MAGKAQVDIDKLKEEIYKKAQELERQLGCKIAIVSRDNKVDIIIRIDDFVTALIRKVKERVPVEVLQQLDINGTRVLDFIVIRFEKR